MPRSAWKSPILKKREKKLVLDFKSGKASESTINKTDRRDTTIMPDMVGMIWGVHNGKTYIPVKIYPTMIGKKLGSYSRTRVKVKHSSKDKKVNK